MEAVILSKEQFEDLVKRMEEIRSALVQKPKNPDEVFLDNHEFLQLMSISKRTAQTWRDEGIIAFSQVGSKIYYRMSAVQKLLETNNKPAFNSKK
ncbi:MAG: helix-turn-helix domain-containing protein [Bacteroidales bacterium]